ncbi:bh protein [candidate division NPL-UPA2 bacterium]|nr:bh protein [candidate division NPL-UPA2 bacterium]
MTTTIKTELFCLHCNQECLHIITYLGTYLKEVRCQECGTHIEMDRKRILETYTAEVIDRILTKPHRLTEEVRSNLSNFIKSSPIRIITKPLRVAKEIMEVIKEGKGK